MLTASADKILAFLKESDVVLDIGGGLQPFNRANYVLDTLPYEQRRTGNSREYFTKESWIEWDICSRKPFPFADQSIDFVVCSHTLEDIRDPIWVCQEMNRIAKRGYIETP